MNVLLCALAAGAALASAPDAPSDLERFHELITRANNAFRAGDLALTDQKMVEADKALPNQPSALLASARIELAEKDTARAAATLERYADLGLTLPPDRARQFADALSTPPFARAGQMLAANAKPVGSAETVFITEAAPILVEKVALDPTGGMLLGTVRTGGVFRVQDGNLARISDGESRYAVLGLQSDPARGELWVAASALPQVAPVDPAQPGSGRMAGASLLRLDLHTGALKQAYPLDSAIKHSWGDLVLARNGTVYLSDGETAEIWKLAPGAGGLEQVLKSRLMDSPQGMAVSLDGRWLLVADYATGFVRIDLKTGEERRVALPPHATLAGTDGLTQDGEVFYAFQNGVTPDRIVAVRLDRSWLKATSVKVVLRGGPLDQPTAGVVDHGALLFVARSQWSDFTAEDGSPAGEAPAPAVVARLPLLRR